MDLKDASKRELDIDEKENIGCLQNIVADETHFYVLANKKDHKLGYYLFMIDLQNPEHEYTYLINWNNKLDIADCDLQIMREKDAFTGENKHFIVVSYKSIGINTYNVFVIDLDDKLIKYWFEGY